MADIQNNYYITPTPTSTQLYPLTNDDHTPNKEDQSPKTNDDQNQSPVQVNQPCTDNGINNNTYKTPTESVIISTSIFLILIGFSYTLFMALFELPIAPIIFTNIITVFGILMGCSVIFTSIKVDPYFGTITIMNKRFLLFCCNIKQKLQIDRLQLVNIERDPKKKTLIRITFKLIDEKEIKVEINDRNGEESKKIFLFLRNNLPQNIAFSGELTY